MVVYLVNYIYLAGTGVITGTPPNLVVLSTLDKDFGSDKGKLIIILTLVT